MGEVPEENDLFTVDHIAAIFHRPQTGGQTHRPQVIGRDQ